MAVDMSGLKLEGVGDDLFTSTKVDCKNGEAAMERGLAALNFSTMDKAQEPKIEDWGVVRHEWQDHSGWIVAQRVSFKPGDEAVTMRRIDRWAVSGDCRVLALQTIYSN